MIVEETLTTPTALLLRTWFSRAWTFQEIILSRDSVVLCGSKALTWEAFLCGFGYFSHMSQAFTEPNRAFLELASLWMAIARKTHRNAESVRNESDVLKSLHNSQQRYIVVLRQLQVMYGRLRAFCVAPPLLIPPGALLVVLAACRTAESCPGLGYSDAIYALAPLGLTFGQVTAIGLHLALLYWKAGQHPWIWSPYKIQLLSEDILDRPPGSLFGISTTGASTSDNTTRAVLRAIRERECRDPRDRIFASQGILAAIDFRPFKVAYDKTVGDVYTDFYRDLLAWDQRLVNLVVDAGISPSSESAAAPTWVPHFANARKNEWLPATVAYDYDAEPTTVYGGASAVVEDRQLVMKGNVVDEIIYCSDTCKRIGDADGGPVEDFLRASVNILQWVRAFRSDVNLSDIPDTLPQIVMSTMFIEAAERPHTTEFDIWYTGVKLCLQIKGSEPRREMTMDSLTPLLLNPRALKSHVTFCNHLASTRRRLFVTARGYAGTGSEACEVDDEVHLVAGVPVPLPLRTVSNGAEAGRQRHRLVSPAIVIRIMAAEDKERLVKEDQVGIRFV